MKIISIFKARFTNKAHQEAGFTIVELMIASLVFSVILVVITVGVIRFTNGYYRGINSSTTQTTAQNTIDSISQAVQYSRGGTSAGGVGYFCAGSKVFTYTPGKQFGGVPISADRGLYMMDNSGPACSNPASPTGGVELLDKGMRVISASVTQPTAPSYLSNIKIKLAYGDDDLLCSQTASPGSCTNETVLTGSQFTNSDVFCKAHLGSQFCSVVELSTVAQQRLQN
jgi:prepilin-type N-terminal cleavage/methylation domain-containing protein